MQSTWRDDPLVAEGERSSGRVFSRAGACRSLVIAFALALLLTGCFTSSQPKFPLSTAVAALGDGGHYVSYERTSDGGYKRDEMFTVRKRADGGYDYIDSKGKVTSLSLHRIGPNLYVAQALRENGHTADYVILRVQGNEVLSYLPDCAKQDPVKMKRLGVEIRDNGRICAVDRVADPAALFAMMQLGEPGGKMVRE